MRHPWKSKSQELLLSKRQLQVERKKSTTISSETHEVFVVTRKSQPAVRLWCVDCNAEVDMLKPEEAAALAQVSTRTVYRLIEATETHHCEGEDGSVVVCPRLLFQ